LVQGVNRRTQQVQRQKKKTSGDPIGVSQGPVVGGNQTKKDRGFGGGVRQSHNTTFTKVSREPKRLKNELRKKNSIAQSSARGAQNTCQFRKTSRKSRNRPHPVWVHERQLGNLSSKVQTLGHEQTEPRKKPARGGKKTGV